MPTTSYTNATFSAGVLGSRTDSAGAPVSDFSAEEARFPAEILTEGYLKPADAFKVLPQDVPNMSVKVGSGTAKADYYVVAGDVQGQGNYIVRLDVVTQTVTIDASDASQARTDEIYLVVRDHAYDASSLVLPQIGYRKGDLGGANPGPDAGWDAYALLARVTVAAASTEVDAADISDQRVASELVESLLAIDTDALITKAIVDAKGDLIAATAADTVARLAVGTNGQVLTADNAQATGIKWATPVTPTASEAFVSTRETTNSTTFTNLTTAGPAVTITVGQSGIAIVFISANIDAFPQTDLEDDGGNVSFELSGANTLAASANNGASANVFPFFDDPVNNDAFSIDSTVSRQVILSGLTPGATTFTAKYNSFNSGNFPDFSNRRLGVVTF